MVRHVSLGTEKGGEVVLVESSIRRARAAAVKALVVEPV